MGSSGMGVDANGKPIKRQAPANNNAKKGGNNNNQKKGNSNKGNNRNNNQGNRGGNQQRQHGPPMGMVPPFAPMGPGGFMPGGQGFPGGFNGNQRRNGGKNNGNRNGAQQPGYNGPSANNVGQGPIGHNMNGGMAPFGGPEPAVEVPGFGKNSNIHELFGKMIWRKMEQIQDAAMVDQLQNRIMNLIHDALAGQSEKQHQQQQQQAFGNRPMSFGMPTNQKGPAFNNFQRF